MRKELFISMIARRKLLHVCAVPLSFQERASWQRGECVGCVGNGETVPLLHQYLDFFAIVGIIRFAVIGRGAGLLAWLEVGLFPAPFCCLLFAALCCLNGIFQAIRGPVPVCCTRGLVCFVEGVLRRVSVDCQRFAPFLLYPQ